MHLILFTLASAYSQTADGSIAGTIRSHHNHEPLRRVLVRLFTSANGGQDATAYTDDDGRYRFTDLPPGPYRLTATLRGYLEGHYGAVQWNAPAQFLKLSQSEARQLADWELVESSQIRGRVRYIDGDPFANAWVTLHKPVLDRGKKTLKQVGTSLVNEAGEYRLMSVLPGTYYLRVEPKELNRIQAPARVRADRPQPESTKVYGASYYPDARYWHEAKPIRIEPGQQLTGVDFQLAARTLTPIQIQVIPPQGVALPQAAPLADVYLVERLNAISSVGVFQSQVELSSKPTRLGLLAAGQYRVLVTAALQGVAYAAARDLEVREGAGEPLILPLEPATDISGVVEIAPGGTDSRSGFTVALSAVARDSQVLQAATDQERRFRFREVTPTSWSIDVRPMPKGAYIKSILLNDQELSNNEFTVAGQAAKMRIILGTDVATLQGMATDRDGNPDPRLLILVPERGSHQATEWVREITNEQGAYKVTGLRPGAYRVYSLPSTWDAAAVDSEVLSQFLAQSRLVQLKPGVVQTLDLTPDSSSSTKH